MAVTTSTIQVRGMTCDHCAGAVRKELGELAGVQQVDVDLATGQVVIRSEGELPAEGIEAAVVEAGYELAG